MRIQSNSVTAADARPSNLGRIDALMMLELTRTVWWSSWLEHNSRQSIDWLPPYLL